METLINLNYDWLHNKIIYNSPARLYQQASVKTSACLWYEQETIDTIGTLEVERLMREKTTSLPEPIKINVDQMVKVNEEQLIQLTTLLPDPRFKEKWWILLKDKIVWTSQGTIDQRRTTEAIADSADFDVETRFKTAVEFCLEDRINALALQLPNDYLIRNKEWMDQIIEMDGISIAKEHFNIAYHLPNYRGSRNCFMKMLHKENYVSCHYYWQRVSDQDKLEFLHPERADRCLIIYNVLFLFTHFDKERKLQILRHQYYRFKLITELSQIRWLPIYEIFVKDLLRFSTMESVVEILYFNARKVLYTSTYKNNYVKICAMALQFLSKDSSTPALESKLHALIIDSMRILVEKDEIEIVKNFLGSVSHEWTKKQFGQINDPNPNFISVALKCEMLEMVFSSALPTVEEKRKFTTQGLRRIILYLFPLVDQVLHSMDTILTSLYVNYEEVEKFRIEFAGKSIGRLFWYNFFDIENWKTGSHLVRCCSHSEKEVLPFYKKFFPIRDCAGLFESGYLNNSSEAIASVICISSLLEQVFDVGEIISVWWAVFTYCYEPFEGRHLNAIGIFFRALDSLLLAFTNKDSNKFSDLKKEFSMSISEGKLNISVLSNFVHKQLGSEHSSKDEANKLYHKVVSEFFS